MWQILLQKKMRITYFNKLISLFLLVSIAVFGQKNSTSATANVDNIAESNFVLKTKIFRQALKYADLAVAKSALFEMIALKPTEKNLKDSLALIYINMGQPQQALLLSKEILLADPNNMAMLEVKAIAGQSIGLAKEALIDYETLFASQKSIFHLYQIATLQYDLKRMAECNTSLEQIITAQDVEKQQINIGTGQQNGLQKISLKAAALNIKGVLAMDLNEIVIAKQCFSEALKINQDFVLARNNMQFIENKTQTPASTATNPSKFKK